MTIKRFVPPEADFNEAAVTMEPNSLLFKLAAPAALDSARFVASATSQLGQKFADFIKDVGSSEASLGDAIDISALAGGVDGSTAAGDDLGDVPLGDQLKGLAGRFRNWLKDQGITTPFNLNFQSEADGGKGLEIDGGDASRIESLLAESPEWSEELLSLAEQYQAELGQFGDFLVQLQITDRDSSFGLR